MVCRCAACCCSVAALSPCARSLAPCRRRVDAGPTDGAVLQPFVFDPAHPYAARPASRHRHRRRPPGRPSLAPAAGTVTFAGTVPTSGKTRDDRDRRRLLRHARRTSARSRSRRARRSPRATPVGTIGPSGDPRSRAVRPPRRPRRRRRRRATSIRSSCLPARAPPPPARRRSPAAARRRRPRRRAPPLRLRPPLPAAPPARRPPVAPPTAGRCAATSGDGSGAPSRSRPPVPRRRPAGAVPTAPSPAAPTRAGSRSRRRRPRHGRGAAPAAHRSSQRRRSPRRGAARRVRARRATPGRRGDARSRGRPRRGARCDADRAGAARPTAAGWRRTADGPPTTPAPAASAPGTIADAPRTRCGVALGRCRWLAAVAALPASPPAVGRRRDAPLSLIADALLRDDADLLRERRARTSGTRTRRSPPTSSSGITGSAATRRSSSPASTSTRRRSGGSPRSRGCRRRSTSTRSPTAWRELPQRLERRDRLLHPDERRGPQGASSGTFLQRIYDNGDVYEDVYAGLYCVGCEEFKTRGRARRRQVPDPRHRPRVDRGEELLLPPLGLPGAAARAVRERPDFVLPRLPLQRGQELHRRRAARLLDQPRRPALGHAAPVGREPGRLRLGRRARQLPERAHLRAPGRGPARGVLARGAPPDGARTSSASTASTGRRCCCRRATTSRSSSSSTATCCSTTGRSRSRSATSIDPLDLIDVYGADAVRFWCARAVSFGQDGSASLDGHRTSATSASSATTSATCSRGRRR